LDDRPERIGRSFAGVRVLGPTAHLLALVEEFAEHGIETHRVLVGNDPETLSQDALADIQHVCAEHQATLQFIPALVGLDRLVPKTAVEPAAAERPSVIPSRYLQSKRALDFIPALVLLMMLIPVFALVILAVLVDVGTPVLFWQRRIGRNGYSFHIYKFRTLRPSFDWQGEPMAEDARLSWTGRTLRKLRLDELPQLLNVIVGDMSLVGPRPLLPRDQPDNPAVRLSVRPGITGWAQIHGGASISSDEKNKFDEWYVENASFLLDVKIMAKTCTILLLGGRRLGETRPLDVDRKSAIEPPRTQPREA
jgi:lipopolysaccharide/colanic/teichoic acid biosynthesis glycosyltransferase